MSTAPKLSDYLRAKSGEQEKKKESCSPAGCLFPLGFALVMYGLAAEALWGMAAGVGAIVLAIIVAVAASEKATKQKAANRTVVDDFVWLYGQRALVERVDPRALPLLEACASARDRAVASLESSVWAERAKDANWAQIRTSALEAVEGAMVDALTTSRSLVRTKGMKQVVFAARCADPVHGAGALARLEELRREMEELATRVQVELAAPEPEPSTIRRVLDQMHEVHVATQELDEDLPRLQQ